MIGQPAMMGSSLVAGNEPVENKDGGPGLDEYDAMIFNQFMDEDDGEALAR